MKREPSTARGSKPAPVTMPAEIDQKRKAMSIGSLMAVRKRTIDSAPTMPRERMTLEVTARMMRVVTRVMATSDAPKEAEYITPLKVLR